MDTPEEHSESEAEREEDALLELGEDGLPTDGEDRLPTDGENGLPADGGLASKGASERPCAQSAAPLPRRSCGPASHPRMLQFPLPLSRQSPTSIWVLCLRCAMLWMASYISARMMPLRIRSECICMSRNIRS